MKVALVHMRHRGTGGTERYLNQLAAHLGNAGHEVTIICRSHEEPPHPTVRFAVLRPLAIGAAWRMWSFAQAVEHHLGSIRYDVVFGLGKTWTHDVIRLGGGCHETYLELAHEAVAQPKAWAGQGSIKHRLALAIERRALRMGAYRHVITNSDMVRRDVCRRYHVPADLVSVIYNGVDLDRFHPRHKSTEGAALRRSFGFDPDHFVVLFLGTGYGRKGLDILLAAFPLLLDHCPQARLVVAGYDSAQRHFESQAKQLGLARCIAFVGGRRDPEAVFAAANLYVLPTRYDPFANTTLEAMASGVPVITTEQNGASEVMEHRVHGSILTARNRSDELMGELLWWAKPGRTAAAGALVRSVAARHSAQSAAEATTRVLENVARSRTTGHLDSRSPA
jgi:UDP-glucose:(heptosyl)LPS alpha-1,3-glucosyltransferase